MEPDTPNLELLEPPAPVGLLPDHSLWFWAMIAVACATLLALGWWFAKRRKRRKSHPDAHRIEAYRTAKAQLEAMNQPEPRACATAASLILRRYLVDAAQDPSLFETHEEFLHRSDALQGMTAEAREAARAGFNELAALKYGPDRPDATSTRIATRSLELLETLHQGLRA